MKQINNTKVRYAETEVDSPRTPSFSLGSTLPRTIVINPVNPCVSVSAVTNPEPEEKQKSHAKLNTSNISFDSVSKLVKYLESYSITVPVNWVKETFPSYKHILKGSSYRSTTSSLNTNVLLLPSPYVIDQIIKAATWWMPYLSAESWDYLVLHMVSYIVSIGACAVGSYPNLENSYLFNIPGVFKTGYLPPEVMMSINKNGNILISCGKGAPPSKL